MPRRYKETASVLRYLNPSTNALIAGVSLSVFAALILLAAHILALFSTTDTLGANFMSVPAIVLQIGGYVLAVAGLSLTATGLISLVTMSEARKITHQTRKALYLPAKGNPLKLKDGELLPKVKTKKIDEGKFELSVSTSSVTVEEIGKAASAISSGLSRRFRNYAVVKRVDSIARNDVTFTLADVTVDRAIKVSSIEQLKPLSPTKLIVQKGTYIDLTASGSILLCGATRSGKSMTATSLLGQVLQVPRSKYSEVLLIDPKRAEISQLPHTVTLDDDGEARAILKAMQKFAETVTKRQEVINECTRRTGKTTKYYNAGLSPNFIFIDEYISLRSLLPKRASKDDPNYSVEVFDSLLKRIAHMGNSAGCFVMLSIAQASTEQGLPTALRSAMTTRILLRPTPEDGRLLGWNSEMVETLPKLDYSAGQAWFSSSDGIHHHPSLVHFPVYSDNFKDMEELSRLLIEYYRQ